MKTILKFAVIIIFTIFITACGDVNQDTAFELEAKSATKQASKNGGSVINQEYTDAQAEVLKTFTAYCNQYNKWSWPWSRFRIYGPTYLFS